MREAGTGAGAPGLSGASAGAGKSLSCRTFGAVAQLGELLLCKQGARRSIPGSAHSVRLHRNELRAKLASVRLGEVAHRSMNNHGSLVFLLVACRVLAPAAWMTPRLPVPWFEDAATGKRKDQSSTVVYGSVGNLFQLDAGKLGTKLD